MCEIGGNLNLADNSTFYQFISDVNQFYMSLHPYLSILICISGVLMNSASIVVLTRPSMIVSPINCLLTSVAVCDVVTMMSCFNFAVRMVTFGDCLAKYTKEWIITLLIHSNLTVVGHTVSIWLTVFMAIVRAFTVQSAGGARSSQTGNERRASPLGLRISMSVLLAVVLLNLPSYLTFAVRQEPMIWRCPAAENPALAAKYPDAYNNNRGLSIRHQNPNSTIFRYLVYNAVVTDLARRNNCLILKFTFWIQGALFKFVPCVLLSIFIGVLVCILTRVRRRRVRLRLTSDNARTDRTTLMLIVLLTVFLLTELPQGILSVLTGVFDQKFRFNVYHKLGDLIDLLSLMNSASNFIIYFAMSQKFREVFRRTLLPPGFWWSFNRHNGSPPSGVGFSRPTAAGFYSTAPGSRRFTTTTNLALLKSPAASDIKSFEMSSSANNNGNNRQNNGYLHLKNVDSGDLLSPQDFCKTKSFLSVPSSSAARNLEAAKKTTTTIFLDDEKGNVRTSLTNGAESFLKV